MGDLYVNEEFQQNNAGENRKNISSEKLANASFVLGIISLFSVFCCCPFVLSAIGITLALLSKGASEMLKPKAKTGLILSVVGLFTSLAVVVGSVVMPFVMSKLNPAIGEEFTQQYLDVLEQNEDFYRDTYGDETYDMLEDMINNSNLFN